MNRVQEAIADITGLSEVVDSQHKELEELFDVVEHLGSDNIMLQRQIEDLDYLNLFEMNQIQEIIPMRDRKKAVARLRKLRHDNPLAKQAVKLVVRFTLGRGVQWVLAGEKDAATDSTDAGDRNPGDSQGAPTPSSGPPPLPTKLIQLPRAAHRQESVIVDSSSDPARDILESFWFDSDNKLAFTTHKSMQSMLDEILTDGEKFYGCFEATSPPYVKVSEVALEEITQIIYDPDNKLRPVFYRRNYSKQVYDGKAEVYKPDGPPVVRYYYDYRIKEGEKIDLAKRIRIPKSKIDEAKIRHVMINEVWTRDGKRGLSELYASREWFRVFREFMEGRAAINAAAQAISYVRKIKGGPSSVARFSGKLGQLPVGDSPENNNSATRQLTKPVSGAIYDSNEGVDIDWMKTDTGAQNAKEDARLLLMSAGAGVGTMVHYFGEGGDANLATAQSMELPMVKSYEDWQQFVEDFHKGWFEYVLNVANGAMDEESFKETEDVLRRIGFTFPPIISQDVVKYTTSWSQIVRDIAPNNKALKRQAIRAVLSVMQVPNIDGIMPEIEAEMDAAEEMRVQQQNAMLELANSQPDPATSTGPMKLPNEGADPNLKALAKGKVKAANGPKSA